MQARVIRNDRIGRLLNGGVGDALDTNIPSLVHDGCAHGGSVLFAIWPARLCASTDRRSVATDHRHLLRRITLALDLDLQGSIGDCLQIVLGQLNFGGGDILL
jgi:hypothetical protein